MVFVDLPVEFVPGARFNSQMLRVGNFLYRKKREKADKKGVIAKYFVCYDKLCSATLVMALDKITLGKHLHNHPANYQQMLKFHMEYTVRNAARKDSKNLRDVFDEISVKEM
jgi:hypothetical protein